MRLTKHEIEGIEIVIEQEAIILKYGNGQRDCKLEYPSFEIEGIVTTRQDIKFIELKNKREMANGGIEFCLSYQLCEERFTGLRMELILRYFSGSPFVRYKYILQSEQPIRLTKSKNNDCITYTGIALEKSHKVIEIQFAQFDPMVHSFIPHEEKITEAELDNSCNFVGPIALIEGEEYTALLAYEHGAQYPDSYLHFKAEKINEDKFIKINARKGNYYNGQIVDNNHHFETIWFHFGVCNSTREDLLKHYHTFFLKYICEYGESRKPYIFYNTWNNQERNKYYHNLPYLYSMNEEHIMKEIDVAHAMGIDVFVIDTGWYNKTGDWLVNETRFPGKLLNIKKKLDGYQMKLGLWFNPIVAAKTSSIVVQHPEYIITKQGNREYSDEIWETEGSYGMCLASDYKKHFIEKMIQLHDELGVIYFKWDAIGQYGCDSPLHHHGSELQSNEERRECYSYQMGIAMINIVEEVSKRCPEIIVDFDITEGGRFVGLGFLSVGKYFLMNSGPYYSNFDIPASINMVPNTINVFFHPGPARNRVCRQGLRYDEFIPSILFLTHFLPDGPRKNQSISLASLMLGGNGIWGDILSLSDEEIAYVGKTLTEYKKVAKAITESYPRVKGFIGSSPEIYEKIDYKQGIGIICFFTHEQGEYTYLTEPFNIENIGQVIGADEYRLTNQNRIECSVRLAEDEARFVFLLP